jgi:hypothetical protein
MSGFEKAFEKNIIRANLFSSRNKLDHFLQSSSAMLVQRNLYQLGCGIIDESSTLLVVRIFKKLLTEIVPEGICKTRLLVTTYSIVSDFKTIMLTSHQLHYMHMSLLEYQLNMLRITFL